jgi:DNA-binding transcriptional ArsR family regulator
MRRQIFEALRMGPHSVASLAKGLPISRPAVSQHLKILKQAGLATVEVQGTRRIYRPDQAGLTALRSWLDEVWGEVSDAYQAEIQRQIDERKST